MKMYEFNLWDKMVLREKIVKEFRDDEVASTFINERWKDRNLLFTWASLTGYKYNDTPPTKIKLTEEEMQMKRDLRASFTPESVNEWGKGEMSAKVSKDSEPHPDAKGYTDIK